ncbi:MAG: hypothetical protein J3K34DRAFT_222803 [Monoraphidium minutum]|nr:MAG: hypothetical protein J3K34DRAFT_222803 [Monoraphidium minutum]
MLIQLHPGPSGCSRWDASRRSNGARPALRAAPASAKPLRQAQLQRRHSALQASSGDGAGAGGSGGDAAGGAPPPRRPRITASSAGADAASAPWALMGRVVREESLGLTQAAREALVARAVAERCGGLSEAELRERLEALAALVPSLAGRLLLLRADLLGELVGDVGAVAAKMLQLKAWFPTADLAELVGRRPSLLSAAEFGRVGAARRQLLARFPDPGGGGAGAASAAVDRLVTAQPLLLVEDVEALLAELERLLPGTDAAAALLRDPGLADSVACNRGLSLW